MIEPQVLRDMEVGEALAAYEGSRGLAQAEGARLAVLRRQLEETRVARNTERLACNLTEDGWERPGRVQRSSKLDSLENRYHDLSQEIVRAEKREREAATDAGVVELEFGQMLSWWREDPEGYPAKLKAEVEAAFAEVRDSRDGAEEAYHESECRAFDVGEGADIQTRLNAERDRAYRAAVLPAPQAWQFYGPGLERIAREKGRRLARMVQARLWREQLMPQGMGVIA